MRPCSRSSPQPGRPARGCWPKTAASSGRFFRRRARPRPAPRRPHVAPGRARPQWRPRRSRRRSRGQFRLTQPTDERLRRLRLRPASSPFWDGYRLRRGGAPSAPDRRDTTRIRLRPARLPRRAPQEPFLDPPNRGRLARLPSSSAPRRTRPRRLGLPGSRPQKARRFAARRPGRPAPAWRTAPATLGGLPG